MSLLEEAYSLPLEIQNNENTKIITKTGKKFFASLFSDYIYKLFNRVKGIYDYKELDKMILQKDDYKKYKNVVWRRSMISYNFVELLKQELKKKGIELHKYDDMNNSMATFYATNHYVDKYIMIRCKKKPIKEI